MSQKKKDPILWVDAFLETVRNVLEQSHINPRAVQEIARAPNPSNVALYKELQELHDQVGTSLRSSFSRHREYVHRHTSILARPD